jgi:nucleotide sugar dehydrogenase
MNIAIVGQGYVGLPLAMAGIASGFNVIGFDKDENKVRNLKKGISEVEDVLGDDLRSAFDTGRYRAVTGITFDSNTSIILICVPTPLGKNHQPDLEILKSAANSVGKNLKHGMLVIIESTIQPGTTRNVVVPKKSQV